MSRDAGHDLNIGPDGKPMPVYKDWRDAPWWCAPTALDTKWNTGYQIRMIKRGLLCAAVMGPIAGVITWILRGVLS